MSPSLSKIALLLGIFQSILSPVYAQNDHPDGVALRFLKETSQNILGNEYQEFDYKRLTPVIKVFDKIKDPTLKARTAYHLGFLSMIKLDRLGALKYLRIASDLARSTENWEVYSASMRRLCQAYAHVQQHDSILVTLRHWEALQPKIPKGYFVLYYLYSQAWYNAVEKPNPDKVIEFGFQYIKTTRYYDSVQLREPSFQALKKHLLPRTYVEIARAFYGLGKFSDALKYAKMAYVLTKENGDIGYQTISSGFLLSISLNEKKVAAAKDYFSKYNSALGLHQKYVFKQFTEISYYLNEYNEFRLKKSVELQQLERIKSERTYLGAFLVLVIALLVLAIVYNRRIRKYRESLHESLEEKLEITQQHNVEKSKYFAIMAHELRTPIYALTGLSKLMENPENRTEENLSVIVHSGNHLLNLVNNIIQYNSITDSSKVHLETQASSLLSILVSSVQTTNYFSQQSDVKVVLEHPLTGDERVYADKPKLAQVIINLLTNAIRHSFKDGTVLLKLLILEQNQDDNLYRILVKDNGVGIASQEADKIFEFEQLGIQNEVRHKDTMRGLGVGLYVVYRYLQAMGSQIQLTSDLGKGATFYFDIALKTVLPLARDEKTRAFTKEYTVLVVDDNKINLIVSKKMLTSIGLKCITATDEDPVTEIVSDRKVDLILMDINMPTITGYDLSRKLRENGFAGPIIALTALLAENIDQNLLKESGIQDFIIKPYELEEFRKTLMHYLEFVPPGAQ